MRWFKACSAYREYGINFVERFVIDVERLEEWRGVTLPGFKQALANANCPPFNPCGDLKIQDDDGILYNAAVHAAWETLQVAFAREKED